MKLIRFSLPQELPAWEALSSQEGVDIEKEWIVEGDNGASAYVKYTLLPELLDHENDRIQLLHDLADRLADDKVLPALKNATQRELYLLEAYNVDSYTAGRVWEYMKMQEKRKEVQ